MEWRLYEGSAVYVSGCTWLCGGCPERAKPCIGCLIVKGQAPFKCVTKWEAPSHDSWQPFSRIIRANWSRRRLSCYTIRGDRGLSIACDKITGQITLWFGKAQHLMAGAVYWYSVFSVKGKSSWLAAWFASCALSHSTPQIAFLGWQDVWGTRIHEASRHSYWAGVTKPASARGTTQRSPSDQA